MSDVLTKRPISHDEATDALRRLINSHFRNPDQARASIPARPDYDDDLVMGAYLKQVRERIEVLERELEEAAKRFETMHKSAAHFTSMALIGGENCRTPLTR